jgi:hypothetical protein
MFEPSIGQSQQIGHSCGSGFALRRVLVKGKFLLSAFASCALALGFSMSSAAQVAKPATDAVAELQRYEAYVTAAYSSANQVKGSSALIGFNAGVDAKLKKWFGGTVDFGQYANSTGVAKPTVTTLLAGPEFYIPSGNLTGFAHVLFGGAHTGGVTTNPDISFAYGVGGGFQYAVSPHLSIRVSGDGIRSSFTAIPFVLGDSPHSRLNARATGGIAYRF